MQPDVLPILSHSGSGCVINAAAAAAAAAVTTAAAATAAIGDRDKKTFRGKTSDTIFQDARPGSSSPASASSSSYSASSYSTSSSSSRWWPLIGLKGRRLFRLKGRLLPR